MIHELNGFNSHTFEELNKAIDDGNYIGVYHKNYCVTDNGINLSNLDKMVYIVSRLHFSDAPNTETKVFLNKIIHDLKEKNSLIFSSHKPSLKF